MSDFVSNFWSIYIAVLTLAGMAACALLVKAMSSKRASGAKPELHGHVWDEDLREYNNPLPRWWMWSFYLSILFSLGYLVFYPGLGSFTGYLGWTTEGSHREEMQAAAQKYGPIYQKYLSQDLVAIAADPEARATGQRLFLNSCAQCHGSDGGGARGFPNLADKDWLYGGDPQTIKSSIAEGRNGMMPPFAALGEEAVNNTAAYVLSLSGASHEGGDPSKGREMFAATCAACHGPDGAGNTALGAPNLTDKTWLHGGTFAKVRETIANGRQGQMPAHKMLLDEAKIHVLAAYVYGLSQPVEPVKTAARARQ